MSTPTAKELLAQADELIRRTRVPADLPVLTELVSETPRSRPTSRLAASVEGIPDLTELVDAPRDRRGAQSLEVEEISFEEFKREALVEQRPLLSEKHDSHGERREPSLGLSESSRAATEAIRDAFPSHIRSGTNASTERPDASKYSSAASSMRNDTDATATYTKDQFNAAVVAKLEQMQHSVYSQVMQQLELHATGEMKRKLREALEPALTQVALDLAAQVAEETSIQMQQIVSNAVENEVARLREQILNKRRDQKI